MKKPWHKNIFVWISISVIAVGIAIAIPFFINYAYLKGTPDDTVNTAFGASDMISLYGSIVTSIATIIAVVLTIIFTAKWQKEQRRYDAKYADLNRRYQDIIEHLRKTIDSMSPIRFFKIATPIYISNYQEKKESLHIARLEMVYNIKMIRLYLFTNDYDETVTSYLKELSIHSDNVCAIITNISTICDKFTEYKIQQNENEKYTIMQQMSSIHHEQLASQP